MMVVLVHWLSSLVSHSSSSPIPLPTSPLCLRPSESEAIPVVASEFRPLHLHAICTHSISVFLLSQTLLSYLHSPGYHALQPDLTQPLTPYSTEEVGQCHAIARNLILM
ncbi:unnamed protein product [Protopolystoma xenopodis]|uniref:Uncharacterized protein n=1 Tax=Protopolystoma xenopodis TaxID=117903 RepID=A0A3S4ZMH5_9PLAT|nr:unnamed protein product [Protopolystoma xenopodis]